MTLNHSGVYIYNSVFNKFIVLTRNAWHHSWINTCLAYNTRDMCHYISNEAVDCYAWLRVSLYWRHCHHAAIVKVRLWSCHTRGKMTEYFLDDFPSEIRRRSKARKQWSTVTREGVSRRISSRTKDIFREWICSFLRDFSVITEEIHRDFPSRL